MLFTLQDDELATADLAALTADMSNIEKIEWAYIYTHRAANRQGQLIRLYLAGSIGYLGYDIDLPQNTIGSMKAEVNALATRIVTAQGVVDSITS